MSYYNLICGIMLTAVLACFLTIPQQTFAISLDLEGGDGYQILSEFDSKRISENFPGVLYDKWSLLFSSGYSAPAEKTVLSLLKEVNTLNLWNYYFKDLPVDVSLAVTNQAVEISKLVAAEDVSGLLNKIEKETAKAAVNYLKDYFFKNQIKASFGAMEVKYKTGRGDVDSPFQYIIVYKSTSEGGGRVVARIYSPKEIIPPASSGSIGMTKGFLNSLDSGEKIPPFIVEISGEMEKGMYGSYFWVGSPEIRTIFPEKVPDFELKPKTWQEKYITDPIKKKINDVLSFGSFLGFQTEVIDYVLKDGNVDKINAEIKDIKEGNDVVEKYPEEKKSVVKTEERQEKEVKIVEEEKFVPAPCSKNSQPDGRHNIIFNEIAWMGGKTSSNDEWVELKNVSGKDIDLNGYMISNKEGKIDIIFSSYILKNGGFVLLERTDDISVPFKEADIIYKGAISNTDEELYLFDSSCNVEDYVSANPVWPAGDNAERRTMERMSDFSWLTYSGSGSGNIWGTPGESNSQGLKKEEKKEEKKESVQVQTVSSSSSFSGGGPDPISYCSQSDLASPTRQIVINEVAWMGSESSSSNEWIELKSVSEAEISLNNWQLLDKGNQIKVVFSSSNIIGPGGFYLLERSDDDSVPNVPADKIYTGALSDTEESLRLFDQNCNLIDEVLADPDWSAGDKEGKKTMERGGDFSWHAYFNTSADSLSGLRGTPKAENSIEGGSGQEETPSQEEDIPEPEEEEDEEIIPLLITEVRFDESGGHEYVEFFNSSDREIDLCASEINCYYLSYYSSTSRWSDPHRNWKFLDGETILPDSYYIVDIFGDSGGDWRVEKTTVAEGESPYYSSGQMAEDGSLALFSGNPRYGEEDKSDEEKDALAVSMKIDAVAWGNSDPEALVREGGQFIGIGQEKVLGRKWSLSGYQDTNDNASDFQMEIASPRSHAPKPPSKIQNLSVAENPGQNNSVILSWLIPEDDDTPGSDLSYEIYYSRNGEIDENNLSRMDNYVSFTVAPAENGNMTALIPDLYYSSDYSFAVKARDPQGNYSPLSDSVSRIISPAIHQKPAPLYDFKRSNQAKFAGPTGNIGETFLLVGENDGNPNNDQFSYFLAIDENGTVYFSATIDGDRGIYAYSPEGEQKWFYDSPTGQDPSLGEDGSVIFSTSTSIVSLSPSGKLDWQIDFLKIYTTHIAIDSKGKIYFVASEEPDNAAIFSFDGNSIEKKLEIGSLLNFSVTELVIDDNDNVYFSKGDTIFRIDSAGSTKEKVFLVEIVSGYSGLYTGRVDQVHIAPGGTVLFNLAQGWCCYDVQSTIDVFYSVSNDLEELIWKRKEYGPVLGVNGEEVYVSQSFGSYKVKAVSLSDGAHRWIKGPFFPPTSRIVSDSGGNIYFAYNLNIFGYDLDVLIDESPSSIFSFSDSQSFNYAFPSIGNNTMYMVQNNRILGAKY